jgi:hypothetical protein
VSGCGYLLQGCLEIPGQVGDLVAQRGEGLDRRHQVRDLVVGHHRHVNPLDHALDLGTLRSKLPLQFSDTLLEHRRISSLVCVHCGIYAFPQPGNVYRCQDARGMPGFTNLWCRGTIKGTAAADLDVVKYIEPTGRPEPGRSGRQGGQRLHHFTDLLRRTMGACPSMDGFLIMWCYCSERD